MWLVLLGMIRMLKVIILAKTSRPNTTTYNSPFREAGGEILPLEKVANSLDFKFRSNKERKVRLNEPWSLVQANSIAYAAVFELFQVLDADAFTFQELLGSSMEYIKPRDLVQTFN